MILDVPEEVKNPHVSQLDVELPKQEISSELNEKLTKVTQSIDRQEGRGVLLAGL